ncbi:MAG: metal ABC transporter ATP-binding protein [Pseudomonadota bacterium]
MRHGAAETLSDVSLAIMPGEIVTVVGPNGSGKSTLMRTILGAHRPSAGHVEQRAGLRIGYVPQRLAVDGTMPITTGRFLGLPLRRPAAAIDAALDRVGLADCRDRPLAALSGGQLQRAMLARALLSDPDLMLLDEPTQGLDQPGTAAFYRLIDDLRRETGAAVLMVSHDLHVVMSASDRVICLNGHVCCEGTPQVVAAAPAYRALFGHGTEGALALYRHLHDHRHDTDIAADAPARGDGPAGDAGDRRATDRRA